MDDPTRAAQPRVRDVTKLALLFCLTAAAYASVGFGGGSTYNALLVLSGADYRLLPAIALTCNIIVVAGGSLRFARAGHIDMKRIVPLAALSAPFAWLGGRIAVSEIVFVGLLGAALLFSGLRLIWPGQPEHAPPRTLPAWSLAATGGGIGFLAGLVGIGGGIFLAPLLHLTRWGGAQQIAAASSVFILINSLFGLAGQTMKLGDLELLEPALAYWPLLPAVLIGGQIGSHLAVARLNENVIRRLTGVLVLYVAARLLWRFAMLAT